MRWGWSVGQHYACPAGLPVARRFPPGWFGLPPVSSRIRDGTALQLSGRREEDGEQVSFLAVLTQIVLRKSVKGQHDLLKVHAARTPQAIRLTIPQAPPCLCIPCTVTVTQIQVLATGAGCQALDALVSLPAPRAPLALGLPLPDEPYYPRPRIGFSDLCKGLAWGVAAVMALTSPREAGAGWMDVRFPDNPWASHGPAAPLEQLRGLWRSYRQHLEPDWEPARDWESCRACVMLPDGPPPPQIILALTRLGPSALLDMRGMLFGADAHLPTCLLGLAVALDTGRASLIVQGVAGSGKTRTMMAAAILLRAIYGKRFLWLAQQHPALRSAAQDASELLQDAPDFFPCTLCPCPLGGGNKFHSN